MKKLFLVFALTASLAVFGACDEAESGTSAAAQAEEINFLANTDGIIGNAESSATPEFEGEGIDMAELVGGGVGEVFNAPMIGGNMQALDGTIYEALLGRPSVPLQLSPLTAGEELAVMHTNHGDITLRFFPQEAPLAVENFKTLAREGFYDGLIFHRVIPGFMIQGGCPLGRGTSGESIFEDGLGLERSFNVHHFRGALATAHSGPGRTIGSQFYIVQANALHPASIEDFEYLINIQDEVAGEFSGGRHIYVRDVHPAAGLKHFIENGGTPWLDWQWNGQGYGHTVFGHVVTGLDIVDSIATTETSSDRPISSVIIESISFKIYGE
ncbi:MAG: peptidylprolyl isomerase [Defluviitaleaceae bacterium]|nr:peptidylprolyl isomerase [Defluviitaleaceae bacterium]MCL2262816.1 peptidylprolyl isomerase [Defluviitaleaceae bacterium]MCL2263868.1 peptidylprolyl isomerase [Defluviitaleaceae bacterium]